MPEIRPPYVTAPSPLEQAVSEMQKQMHWTYMLVVAMMELEAVRVCPHCGKRLYSWPSGFDTEREERSESPPPIQ